MQRSGALFLSSFAAVLVGILTIGAVGPTPAEPDAAESVGLFTAFGQEIVDGGEIQAGGFSPISIRSEPAAQKVTCTFDGNYLGLSTGSPHQFSVPPPAPGQHKIRCTLRGSSGDRVEIRVGFTVSGGAAASSHSSPPLPTPATPETAAVTTGRQTVSDAASLQQALRTAGPGTIIELRDGIYDGKLIRDPSGQSPGRFTVVNSGTAQAPIVLRGSRAAILTGGGTGGGYALHLKGANHWRLEGFTVQAASKGIVLDRSNSNVIDAVRVTQIGDEGIHFRSGSSDNRLMGSTIDHTGVNSPNYGEGVYIGSARSNWETYAGGEPDRSDRNQIVGNTIVNTAAENIDIKEGSTGGLVRGNVLGGDKIASKNSADSWIDVKGNGYLIDGNQGTTAARPGTVECGDPKGVANSTRNPFCDGIQVHVILDGWGRNNTFTGNTLAVNAPGAGIWIHNAAVGAGNVIRCSNRVTGAAAGAFATNHYTALPCVP